MSGVKDELTYSEAVARLQSIVSDIESGRLDIDMLAERLKEADGLAKFCKKRLFEVDEEVQRLLSELSKE